MRKNGRKLLSLVLALTLVLGMLPGTAWAADADGAQTVPPAAEDVQPETPEEPQPGDGQTWDLAAPDGTQADDPAAQEQPDGEQIEDPAAQDGEQADDAAAPDGEQVEDSVASEQPDGAQAEDPDASEQPDEGTVTRIVWIHELASRFSTGPEDYGFAAVMFSDYSQSEEYYQDAVWAWNMGLFPENDDLSIAPFAPATYEFSANTLCSCLDLGLSEESAAYAAVDLMEDSGSESMQIAERRGWFSGEPGSFDASLTGDEAAAMLGDAEEIVSLAEIQEDYDSTYTYASGVIEVPREIGFEISPDETFVTLYSEDLSIKAGDDFVVYMDALPIAYRALEVSVGSGNTTVTVEKADPSVYEYVDEQGSIALSADNAEFIPAEDVTLLSDGFDFSNGKLSLSTSIGDSKAEVYLEKLSLNHSFSNDGVTVTVSGSWGLTTTLANKDEVGPEIPLGKIRILGVGMIGVSLKLSMGAEMSGTVSGTFSAGVSSMSDGTTRGIHNFYVNNCSVTGKATLSASIKISAGVDVVLAQAIVYGEVGAATQYTDQSKKNANDVLIHCQDYKYYFFLTVGAELKYFAFWKGEMSTLKDFPVVDAKPYIRQWHWENGAYVGSCTMGMTVADQSSRYSGGSTVNIGTSLDQESMDRVLETSVSLPSDYTASGDYTINEKAVLYTNGHAFTVTGDLILNGGTISVSGGSLNVEGDLIINSGSVTTSNSGVINLKGNLRYLDAAGGELNSIVLCGTGTQTFYFQNPDKCAISNLDVNGCNLKVTSSIQLKSGTLQLNSGSMTVEGDALISSAVNLYHGTLDVRGTVKHTYGTITFNKGRLLISGDYRCHRTETNSAGDVSLTYSDGYLCMQYGEDFMRVGGAFVTMSNGSSNSNIFKAGTIELAGDFQQIVYSSSFNFSATGTHKVVLNGTKPQTVDFESASSGFQDLEIAEGSDVTFTGYLRVNKWLSSVAVKSSGLTLEVNNFNGQSVVFNGDVTVNNAVDLSGGTLDVRGTVKHTDGTITFNKGQLLISGDYRCHGTTTNSAGDVSLTYSNGRLSMQYVEDLMRVGGAFVTMSNSSSSSNVFKAGTMELAGDFQQIVGSSSNFYATGTHKVVLNGTKPQTVDFESASSDFQNLEIAAGSDVTFTGYLRVGKWLSSTTVAASNLILDVNNFNGQSVVFNGNVTVNNAVDLAGGTLDVRGTVKHTDGTITFNKGQLLISGDYRCHRTETNSAGDISLTYSNGRLSMQHAEDLMRVGGAFVTKSDYGNSTNGNVFKAGTIELAGDFQQIVGSSSNFYATGTHKVVLNGTKPQTVDFESASSGFQNLEIAAGSDVTFTGYLRVNKWLSSVAVKSSDLILDANNFNGQSVVMSGDVTVNNAVDLAGGTLDVRGTVKHTDGTITFNKGQLLVSGDYRCHRTETNSAGDVSLTYSNGRLSMQHAEDLMRVGGAFVTKSDYGNSTNGNVFKAGTIELAGDFQQIVGSSSNFYATGTHKVILSGTKPQKVAFGSYPSSRFNALYLTQPRTQYTFSPDPCWVTLHEADPEKPVEVSSVSLSARSLTLTKGRQHTLTAAVYPDSAADKRVTWSSSNEAAATVDQAGLVTAVAPGTAKITVTTADGGLTAACTVTVTEAAPVPATGVRLNKTSLSLPKGRTETLTAAVEPEGANRSVTWTSSNPAVAEVTGGRVTAREIGTAVITAKTVDGGFTAKCTVTVTPVQVTGISLNKTSLSLTMGGSAALTATVVPADAADKSVTWSSSNTAVATVSKDGTVTAVAAGSAVITVRTVDGSVSASCTVTVAAPPAGEINVTGVTVDPASLTLVEGGTAVLTATVSPSNATNKNVTWKSSDESVVTVSKGAVTAQRAGTATITAITENGGKTASVQVTVQAKPSELVRLNLTGAQGITTIEGMPLDLSGLVVTAVYSGGLEAAVSDYTVSGFDPSKLGQQNVTISYGGKTASLPVTVEAKSVAGIRIKTRPAKLDYIQGEPFSQSGLTLTATYNNGTEGTITSGFTVTGFDSKTVGTQSLLVLYQGCTDSFTVTVSEKAAAGSVARPVLRIESIEGGKNVVLTAADADAAIYYTMDGSVPTAGSTRYNGQPIKLTAPTTTIKALAVLGSAQSAVSTGVIRVSKASAPVPNPGSGTVPAGTIVTLRSDTVGSEIYYTDKAGGNFSKTTWTKYSSAIVIGESKTIRAIAVKDGYANSDIQTLTYTVPAAERPRDTVVASLGSVTVTAGNIASVPLYLFPDGEDTKIQNFRISLSFDKDAFENAVTVTPAEGIEPTQLFISAAGGAVNLLYMGNPIPGGEVCTLNFATLSSVPGGTKLDVEVNLGNSSITTDAPGGTSLTAANAVITLTAAQAPQVSGTITYTDTQSGQEIDQIGNSGAQEIEANITFDGESLDKLPETMANVYLAIYDRQGRMESVESWQVDLSDPAFMLIRTIKIPENVEVGSIKIMVLSDSMVPLMAASQLAG